MSKILASIADAERYALLCEINRETEDAAAFSSRATAARAEHAEIVAFIREVSEISNRDAMYNAIERAEALLSRVGGGA